MMDADLVSRINSLYAIVEKVASVSAGRHSHIAGEANAELNAINEGFKEEAKKLADSKKLGPNEQGQSSLEPAEPSKPAGDENVDQQDFLDFNNKGDDAKPGTVKARL